MPSKAFTFTKEFVKEFVQEEHSLSIGVMLPASAAQMQHIC